MDVSCCMSYSIIRIYSYTRVYIPTECFQIFSSAVVVEDFMKLFAMALWGDSTPIYR